jgi:hypothetical protein
VTAKSFGDVERWEHGVRARYAVGCRCDPCRKANTAYERERAQARRRGDWNGLVDAARARAHLEQLSTAGVGYRSVSAACDVPTSTVAAIKMGKKLRIRARTEKAILAVDAAAIGDHTLVPAKETWQLLRNLIYEGYTRTFLAKRLGSETHRGLQISKRKVLASTAQKVRKLYRELTE